MVMPQLDVTTFSSQVSWFFITFSVLYLCVHFFIVPMIKKCMDERSAFIDSIKLKTTEYQLAVDVQKSKYDDCIADARSVARDVLSDAEVWTMKYKEDADRLLCAKIESMFTEHGNQIKAFRDGIESELKSLALHIALFYSSMLFGDDFVSEEVVLDGLNVIISDVIKSDKFVVGSLSL